MSLLSVSNISAGYGKLAVLHNVSLRVEVGEVVAIVGANGVGKTTLMKSVFRLLPLIHGSIAFNGEDLSNMPTQKLASLGMGLVPQEGSTFAELSVEDNLRVCLGRQTREEVELGVQRAYDRFPALQALRGQRVTALSGGERQMVALASAFCQEPVFVGLDEPTTGLSPAVVDDVIRQTLEARDRGTTVLWVVEEDPVKVLEHADRVYAMQAGTITQEVAAQEALSDGRLSQLIFGSEVAGLTRARGTVGRNGVTGT